MTLRALKISYGSAEFGGGLAIESSFSGNPQVDIQLTTFQSCQAIGNVGGGAIFVRSGIVNIFPSVFKSNAASLGPGADIFSQEGSIVDMKIDCPPPYGGYVPIQGSALETSSTVTGNRFSFSGCTPDDLCLNNVGKRSSRRLFAPIAGGLFLLKELAGAVWEDFVIPTAISEAENIFFDPDDPPVNGKDCVPFPYQALSGESFCGAISLSHPVTRAVADEARERDTQAANTYEKLEDEDHFQEMLKGPFETCKKITKQSLCVDAFPACDCEQDSMCQTTCDLVNSCAADFKGEDHEKPCFNCGNFCEQICIPAPEGDNVIDGSAATTNTNIFASVVSIAAILLLNIWE